MTFEEWYEDNVKYMTIADFKPWLHEAWDAAIDECIKSCKSWDFNVQSLIKQIEKLK